MGGAVALLLHKKEPSFYNGAVLAAPMCKVNSVAGLVRWLIACFIFDRYLTITGHAYLLG